MNKSIAEVSGFVNIDYEKISVDIPSLHVHLFDVRLSVSPIVNFFISSDLVVKINEIIVKNNVFGGGPERYRHSIK